MILLLIISIIRYLVSGFFIFAVYSRIQNLISTKVFAASFIYALVIIIFKTFVADSPVITFISATAVLICLVVTNKFKNFKFNITYSLFIVCLTEYIHFLFFELFSIGRKALGVEEVTFDQLERLAISRAIVLMLYCLVILLIYKFKKVDIDAIEELSNYRIFPIFLVIALFVITYLKYHIKYTNSNKFHDILSFIFVFFIVLSFVFLFSSKKFLNIIDSLNRKKINLAVEESKLQIKQGISGLRFISEGLNAEMNYFLNILSEMGMDAEDKKSKQIAYCAVLLNHEENPQSVNMGNAIYLHVADILDRQAKTIESNISNAIQALWGTNDKETLEKINRNYKKPILSETGCPTPKGFLLYLIEKYNKECFENRTKPKMRFSFLRFAKNGDWRKMR